MIITNLYVRRSRISGGPLKTYPPPIVYPDAVLTLTAGRQRFETVARQNREIRDCRGRLQPVEFQASGTFNSRERLHSLPTAEIPRTPVSVADYHSRVYFSLCVTSSITNLRRQHSTNSGKNSFDRWTAIGPALFRLGRIHHHRGIGFEQQQIACRHSNRNRCRHNPGRAWLGYRRGHP